MTNRARQLRDVVHGQGHGREMSNPTAVGRASQDGHPPFTVMYVRVHDRRIQEVTFQTFGCAVSIAACETLADCATGLTIDEAVGITAARISSLIEGVPAHRKYCVGLSVDAFHDALRNCPPEVAPATSDAAHVARHGSTCADDLSPPHERSHQ